MTRLALGAALLVSLPSLTCGFMLDDYIQQSVLNGADDRRGGLPVDGAPLDLYRFISGPRVLHRMMERGDYPWWTLDDLELAFFRPLSSATLALDHRLFGRWAPGYHLHSLLWYLVLVAACGLVLRRALPGAAGGLATLLFAVDPSHAVPVAWIANRNALVSFAAAVLGLWCHLRFREDGWRPGRPLSLLGLAAGLLGGESALGVLALLVSYECLGREGPRADRAWALAPVAALAAAYLLAYRCSGHGTSGSGYYLDPLGAPGAFLRAFPRRALALAGGEISRVPSEVSAGGALPAALQLLGGALALGLLAILLRRAATTLLPRLARGARWLIAGSLLALLAATPAMPHNRLALVASLGASTALALVARAALLEWRTGGPRRRTVAILVGVGLVANLGLGLLAAALEIAGLGAKAISTRRDASDLTALVGGAPDRHVVVVAEQDLMTAFYLPYVLFEMGRPVPPVWRVLSVAPCDHRLRRTGPATVELTCLDGRMHGSDFELLVRPEARWLRPGDQVSLPDVTATVLAEAPGGGPATVQFTFRRPLEDSSFLFLARLDGRYRPLALPRVGESVELPREPGWRELLRGVETVLGGATGSVAARWVRESRGVASPGRAR